MAPYPATETHNEVATSVETNMKRLVEALLENEEEIVNLLAEYQPIRVTKYEIEHYIDTLKNVHIIQKEYTQHAGIKICTFLPSNLPTYSLLLFAIIPSFVAKEVVVRPNSLLVSVGSVGKLFKLLKLDEICPNISLFLGDRDEYISRHIANSDLIIFTGRNETKEIIKGCIKPGSYLINNGSGHNPIFVTETADVDEAVRGVTYSKFFNAGQDCAGPDATLVHEKHIKEFMEKIVESVSKLKVGNHYDKEVLVGKIIRDEELQKFYEIIEANKKNVVYGGKVDFENKIVYPTIILSDLTSPHINYNEMFGPILFIYSYTDEKQLKLYFEDFDGKYMQNKMYVSIFSDNPSHRISPKDVGIVLHNKIILNKEIDNGYTAYGGYSRGASAIYQKKIDSFNSVSTPVFLPDVIRKLFIDKRPLKDTIVPKKSFAPDRQKVHVVKRDVAAEFIQGMRSLLGDNLMLAFIRGNDLEEENSAIDAFISVKEVTNDNKELLTKFVADLHVKYGYKPENIKTPEVLKYDDLTLMLYDILHQIYGEQCPLKRPQDNLDMSFLWGNSTMNEQAKSALSYASVLADDNKLGLTCRDKKAVKLLTADAKKLLAGVKREMLSSIRNTETHPLPKYLMKKYPGCTNQEIVNELENMNGSWDVVDTLCD